MHTALERGLIERAGPDVGGRLRAGRSRNDQVATLFRMYLRDHARIVARLVLDVVEALAARRTRHLGVPMPGRTHLQHAQPVLLCTTCSRTPGRCCATSTGSATGTPGPRSLPTARAPWPVLPRTRPEAVAADLGFDSSVENSIDGTASRDFVAEFAFVAAMTCIDVSRLAEEVVIWATKEFSFVTLDDAYSTGSSIMPQKKNPDIAELARGKAGRLVGDLAGLLTTLKALPLAYNRDLQEDKEPVFDAVDTLEVLLPAFAGMVDTWSSTPPGWSPSHRRGSRWRPTSPSGWSARASRSGSPMRWRGSACGSASREASSCGTSATTTSRDISEHLTPGVRDVLSVEGSLASRSARGGTAPARVAEQLVRVAEAAAANRSWAAVRPTVR